MLQLYYVSIVLIFKAKCINSPTRSKLFSLTSSERDRDRERQRKRDRGRERERKGDRGRETEEERKMDHHGACVRVCV